MSSILWTPGLYFNKRTLRIKELDPGTSWQFVKYPPEMDVLLYRSDRSWGLAFASVHKKEQMERDASGRNLSHSVIVRVFVFLGGTEMQRRMVTFEHFFYLLAIVLLVTMHLARKCFSDSDINKNPRSEWTCEGIRNTWTVSQIGWLVWAPSYLDREM